jgi:hypothetical protein
MRGKIGFVEARCRREVRADFKLLRKRDRSLLREFSKMFSTIFSALPDLFGENI